MKTIIKLLLTAIAVLFLSEILPGVTINSYLSAIVVAILLAVLNIFVKPIFIFFTLPFTIITLGLFLFVINALMVLLADLLFNGFYVDGFWWALLFSILLTILQTIINKVVSR